jgi:hypothetical protein
MTSTHQSSATVVAVTDAVVPVPLALEGLVRTPVVWSTPVRETAPPRKNEVTPVMVMTTLFVPVEGFIKCPPVIALLNPPEAKLKSIVKATLL